jgi:hypothetical protein
MDEENLHIMGSFYGFRTYKIRTSISPTVKNTLNAVIKSNFDVLSPVCIKISHRNYAEP